MKRLKLKRKDVQQLITRGQQLQAEEGLGETLQQDLQSLENTVSKMEQNMDSQEQSLEVSSGTSTMSQETFGRQRWWITYHSLCLKRLKWITGFFLQLPSQMEKKNALIKDPGKTFFFTWKNIVFLHMFQG